MILNQLIGWDEPLDIKWLVSRFGTPVATMKPS